jgi:hypothetical protein
MTAKTDIDMPSHMSLGEGGQAEVFLVGRLHFKLHLFAALVII